MLLLREQLIPGELYYMKTMYEWLVVFKNISNNDIVIGYDHIEKNGSSKGKMYTNNYASHSEIRLATEEEKTLFLGYGCNYTAPEPLPLITN